MYKPAMTSPDVDATYDDAVDRMLAAYDAERATIAEVSTYLPAWYKQPTMPADIKAVIAARSDATFDAIVAASRSLYHAHHV